MKRYADLIIYGTLAILVTIVMFFLKDMTQIGKYIMIILLGINIIIMLLKEFLFKKKK